MKINQKNIKKYINLYNQEDYIFKVIGPAIRKKKYVKFSEFYKICMWKSARQKNKYLRNTKSIENITREAFNINNERDKILTLCKLEGVGIPTASSILTIAFPDKYGVIDIRCMEILHEMNLLKSINISINNWLNYLRIIRELAHDNNVTPREIDMALFALHREGLEKKDYKNLYKK